MPEIVMCARACGRVATLRVRWPNLDGVIEPCCEECLDEFESGAQVIDAHEMRLAAQGYPWSGGACPRPEILPLHQPRVATLHYPRERAEAEETKLLIARANARFDALLIDLESIKSALFDRGAEFDLAAFQHDFGVARAALLEPYVRGLAAYRTQEEDAEALRAQAAVADARAEHQARTI